MRTLTLSLFFTMLSAFAFAGPEGRFVYHVVEKGQTLYSISRQYGLKPQELIEFNALADNTPIKLGQKIKIPSADASTAFAEIERPVVTRIKTDVAPAPVSASGKYHVVQKGETLFSISRMYSISRTDLQAWNGLADQSVKLGQRLIVSMDNTTTETYSAPTAAAAPVHSKYSKNEIQKAIKKDGYVWTLPSGESKKQAEKPVVTGTSDATASLNSGGMGSDKVIVAWKTESAMERRDVNRAKTFDPSSEYESMYYQSIYAGLSKRSETGNVKFLMDNVTDNIVYYNNASIGTILKLSNPDNGKTSYAIVVGKVPVAESSYLIKASGKVAKALNSKDYSSIEVVCYTGQ